MEALEEEQVLELDMGEEAVAALGGGCGDGVADQFGAEMGGSAQMRGDAKARTPPLAGLGCMDADGAHDLVGSTEQARDRYDGNGGSVDRVAIIVEEEALLDAEGLAPEAVVSEDLMRALSALDLEVGRTEWRDRVRV